MSAVVFYYRRSEVTTDSKFTIRSVFSTGGSFGFEKVLRRVLRRCPGFSSLFWPQSREAPGSLCRLFRSSPGRGLFDPCKWPTVSQVWTSLYLWNPCLGKIHGKSPQIVNYYGDSELLRRSLCTTARSCGIALKRALRMTFVRKMHCGFQMSSFNTSAVGPHELRRRTSMGGILSMRHPASCSQRLNLGYHLRRNYSKIDSPNNFSVSEGNRLHKSNEFLWHEIITKIIPWELFFVIFEGFWALENYEERKTFSRNYAWDS